jgi:hypothetical protein
MPIGRALLSILICLAALASPSGPARATGTVRILQNDGSTKTYKNVRIAIQNGSMSITSADGQGTLVLGKAACTKVDELIECLPYDATLFQNGMRTHIALQSGTVWVNLSRTEQRMTHSWTELPPRGVMLAFHTRKGTYVTMTGIVDEVQR